MRLLDDMVTQIYFRCKDDETALTITGWDSGRTRPINIIDFVKTGRQRI